MTTIGTILAQSRPADTNAVSVYSTPGSTQTEIIQILVCENSGNTPTFRIFLDNDGTTYDETTALFFDTVTVSNKTVELIAHGSWWMSGGNLAVRTSAANQITFTVFGAEHSV